MKMFAASLALIMAIAVSIPHAAKGQPAGGDSQQMGDEGRPPGGDSPQAGGDDQGPPRGGPGERGRFQKMDSDGDGRISKTEWTAHHAKMFGEMDKDGNGYLSREEDVPPPGRAGARIRTRPREKMKGETQ